MQIHSGISGLVYLAHEVQKLTRPMPGGDASHDVASQDAEGGIQTGRAVALVVVRAPFDLSRSQR